MKTKKDKASLQLGLCHLQAEKDKLDKELLPGPVWSTHSQIRLHACFLDG